MPNEFSIEIHHHISSTLETIRARLARAHDAADAEELAYCRGQLEELAWIREYLKENFDLKGFTYYDPTV
jgi:hypothetical protein